MSHDEFKRAARLPDAARQEVLDRLDRRATSDTDPHAASKRNLRKDTRWAFRHTDVAVTVDHPAGGTSKLLLFSRNISAGGMSFIHNGFLHVKSRCKVDLKKIDGQVVALQGLIVSCRHVSGVLHEIGVKFDRKIDPSQFVSSTSAAMAESAAPEDTPELHGRVLIVDDNEMDRTLLQHHLKQAGMNLSSVCTSGAALDTVKQQIVEIVICELNLDSGDGVELITKMREAGYGGPIVALTSETNAERLEAAKTAGAEHVISKPYDAGELVTLLVEMQRKLGAVVYQSVIYSTVDDQPGMAALITQYIDQARTIARRLERAISENNFADVRQLCMNLKGSAGGYGFAPLSALAIEVLKTLDAEQSIRKSISPLRSLCMLCDRLRLRTERINVPRNTSTAA